MTTFLDRLTQIRRPRLLIRAARFGAAEYNRNRDLRRVLRSEALPGPVRSVPALMDLEETLEQTRREGDAAYSPSRHIDVLTALMGEASLMS